jgi:hypothetical protein
LAQPKILRYLEREEGKMRRRRGEEEGERESGVKYENYGRERSRESKEIYEGEGIFGKLK